MQKAALIDSRNATVRKINNNLQKANIEIYTWDHCPYCQRTIQLLDKKRVNYTRYRIDGDEQAREKMAVRSGGKKTVPQIFIDGKNIGGCDDTHALDAKGELDKLIFKI